MIPIVLGTHEYEWALFPFAELYAKYFSKEPITYIADRQEGKLPFNIKFKRVPCFSEGIWNWYNWFGEGIKSICAEYEGEVILFFLPDHWLNQPVNHKVIAQMENYLVSHPEVVRASLTEDLSWHYWEVESIGQWLDLEILEVKPWSIHAGYNGGLSFCPSLWNADLLKTVVSSGWGFWDFERVGSEMIKKEYPNVRVVGSNPMPINRTHALFHDDKNKVSLDGLSEEDKQIIYRYLPRRYSVCS